MKKILYNLGNFLIRISGQEKETSETERELYNLVKELIDAIRDGKIDSQEMKSLREKAYNLLLDYNFSEVEDN